MSKKDETWQDRLFLRAKEILNEPFRRVLDALFLIYAIVVLISGIGEDSCSKIDYRLFVVITIFYSLVKFVISGMKMSEQEKISFLTKWMYFAGLCTFAALVVWFGAWKGWWL